MDGHCTPLSCVLRLHSSAELKSRFTSPRQGDARAQHSRGLAPLSTCSAFRPAGLVLTFFPPCSFPCPASRRPYAPYVPPTQLSHPMHALAACLLGSMHAWFHPYVVPGPGREHTRPRRRTPLFSIPRACVRACRSLPAATSQSQQGVDRSRL